MSIDSKKPLTIEGFIYFACCIASSLACIASFRDSSIVWFISSTSARE
ncbi:hypothetical protein VPHK137_0063 [Vibrio phage K137]